MRCQCKNITNNYVCRKTMKHPNYINEKRFCYIHYKYYINIYANIIQKNYIGYRVRKYLKNIYLKLPEDIQRIICFYIKEKYYYDKYYNVIGNIVFNKLTNYINSINSYRDNNIIVYYNDLFNHDINNLSIFITFIFNNYKTIHNICDLYSKYKSTLKKEDNNSILSHFIYYNKRISFALDLYEKNIINAYTSHVFDIVSAINIKYNKIINDS